MRANSAAAHGLEGVGVGLSEVLTRKLMMAIASRVKATYQMPANTSKVYKEAAACEAIVDLKITNAELLVGAVRDAQSAR